MKYTNKKIILDVDGVCLDFASAFIEHCKKLDIHLSAEKIWNFFTDQAYQEFKNLKEDFWLNLPRDPKSFDINFEPIAYISHRDIPTEITRQSLLNVGLPDAEVFHTKYTEDKLKIFKDLGGDIFVDDRASTVLYFLENGLDARVFDQLWNEDYYNLARIKTLGELGNE